MRATSDAKLECLVKVSSVRGCKLEARQLRGSSFLSPRKQRNSSIFGEFKLARASSQLQTANNSKSKPNQTKANPAIDQISLLVNAKPVQRISAPHWKVAMQSKRKNQLKAHKSSASQFDATSDVKAQTFAFEFDLSDEALLADLQRSAADTSALISCLAINAIASSESKRLNVSLLSTQQQQSNSKCKFARKFDFRLFSV